MAALPNKMVVYVLLHLVLFTSASYSTTIQVIDQNNQPLANAVVELTLHKVPSASLKHSDSLYVMDQINKAFVPQVLLVNKNSLISFPNSDDIRHHVYSFSAAKTFQLKLYAGQPENPILFEQPGIVVLGCNIHDSMIGYIYITEQHNAHKTDQDGQITFDLPIKSIKHLTLWHPNASEGVDYRHTIPANELSISNGVLTLKININAPELTGSFEDIFADAQ